MTKPKAKKATTKKVTTTPKAAAKARRNAARKPAAKKRAPTVKAIAAKAGVRVEDAAAILDNGTPAAYSEAMVALVLGAKDELST